MCILTTRLTSPQCIIIEVWPGRGLIKGDQAGLPEYEMFLFLASRDGIQETHAVYLSLSGIF